MDKRYRPLSVQESQAARRALADELAAAPSTPIPVAIRKIRTTLRLTIAEYARLCGISARALADIEREAASPTLATVEKLLKPVGMRAGAVPIGAAAPASAGTVANAQERSRIDLGEFWQVDYWTRELGVSADELAEAIAAVGPTIGAIRQHFRK